MRLRKLWRLLICACLGLLFACCAPIVHAIAQPSVPVDAAPSLSAQSLNLQGQQQFEQGNPQAALMLWQQAEQRYRQDGNQDGVIGAQLNQARALETMGFYRRAGVLLEQVVTSQQLQPASFLKATGLLMQGNMLRLTGAYQLSRTQLEKGLHTAQQINSMPAMQMAYLYLGNTLLAQRQLQDALIYFEQAAAMPGGLQLPAQLRQLKLLQQLQRSPEATALLSTIESSLAMQPVSQQTIYGRIDLAELLNHPPLPHPTLNPAQLLATAAQHAQTLGDRQAESYALGRLGRLYAQQQQWVEAKRLTQKALRLARGANVSEVVYQWQWQMGRILKAQGDRQQATAAYLQAVDLLRSLRQDLTGLDLDVQFSFRDQVEPVYRELVDLLLQPDASQAQLKQARAVVESLQIAELQNFFREACFDSEPRSIDQIDPTAAVFYPVILSDRLEVILSLPGQPLHHYATALPQAAIEAGIQRMRTSLRATSFKQERLAASRQIYQWLVQPALSDLTQQNIKTLVFVLDGALRNVPMAALYDGNSYLIEQYQIALAPGLHLLSPRSLRPEEIHALVGGLSEGTAEVTPLPGVRQEVDAIQHQVPAQILLDQSFTAHAFKSQVETTPFTVVHLATHGQFSSEAKDTYVQTWDERLTVNDLKSLLNQRSLSRSTVIELLVLSACETAEGDNRAALGMAGVAVRSGARSTLATLWTVNDASTATFIEAFYKAFTQEKMSKAQAVRSAQLTLLQSPEFQHPFYWAPFILVGNWL